MEGFLYFYGKGAEVNYEKAKALFEKASLKGQTEATHMLGRIILYKFNFLKFKL